LRSARRESPARKYPRRKNLEKLLRLAVSSSWLPALLAPRRASAARRVPTAPWLEMQGGMGGHRGEQDRSQIDQEALQPRQSTSCDRKPRSPKLTASASERKGKNKAATSMETGLSSMMPIARRMAPAAAMTCSGGSVAPISCIRVNFHTHFGGP